MMGDEAYTRPTSNRGSWDGKMAGMKPKLTPEQRREMVESYKRGDSVRDILSHLLISKSLLYRVLAQEGVDFTRGYARHEPYRGTLYNNPANVAYRKRNREKILAKSREREKKKRDDPVKYAEMMRRKRERYRRLKENGQLGKTKESQREWERKNRAYVNAKSNARRLRMRREAVSHYGGKCHCCGESRYEFLAIDHANNNGSEHRKSLRPTERREIYVWLKKNGWPEGFRILCHNCNCAIGWYGYCPHQANRPEPTPEATAPPPKFKGTIRKAPA